MNSQPVVAGAAQLTWKEPSEPMRDAIDVLSAVTELALADAGGNIAKSIDSVSVLRGFWPNRDPAHALADRFGLPARELRLAPPSGNHAQALFNDAAWRIAKGELRAALIVGGEVSYSAQVARREGLPGTAPEGQYEPDTPVGEGEYIRGVAEGYAGVVLPAPLYAIIDSALRAKRGMTPTEHRRYLARMGGAFSLVAARNPFAWRRTPYSVNQLLDQGPGNRPIAFPYSSRLISDWTVDQAAAILLCSSDLTPATDSRNPVYVVSGTDSFDVCPVSERASITTRSRIGLAARRALALADVTLDDIGALDLYSCFPAAVQVQAAELGVADRPQLTVTGGMAFAGGPVNSYALHSLATMTTLLRGNDGCGMITSVGGVLDKQSMTIMSGKARTGFRYEDLTGSNATEPTVASVAAEKTDGAMTIVGSTVLYAKNESRALLLVNLADNSRTLVTSTNTDLVAEIETVETVGRLAQVSAGKVVDIR